METNVPNGIDLIAAERRRQIEVEGWTPEHDDEYDGGELSRAGACYALEASRFGRPVTIWRPANWPWSLEWWKPVVNDHDLIVTPENAERMLVKAGALIAAEIDRLRRELQAERDKVP